MGISRQMTLLGICGMGFYGLLLSQGQVSAELLPQFSLTALLFTFSGRLMERISGPTDEDVDSADAEQITESDWRHLTIFVNWIFALAMIAALIIFVLMPTGMTSTEMIDYLFGAPAHVELGPAP